MKLKYVVFVVRNSLVDGKETYYSYCYDRFSFERDEDFTLPNCRKLLEKGSEIVKEIIGNE